MNKDIRWKQRFQNFEKAFLQLKEGVELAEPNNIEKQGIIKSFEYTYELAWNTLKDYLESKGVEAKFPKDAIKQSFHYEIIKNGEIWMDMIDKRNLTVHTYDEKKSKTILTLIKNDYYPAIENLVKTLKEKS